MKHKCISTSLQASLHPVPAIVNSFDIYHTTFENIFSMHTASYANLRILFYDHIFGETRLCSV